MYNGYTRVGNFQQKNYSAEDRIYGTNGYFRWNYGCSAEQKTLGIPFRTLPWKRKQLGIQFRWTKKEANSWNSLPNPSVEEKTTQISVPWTKNRRKPTEFRSKPFRRRESYSEQNADTAAKRGLFCKTNLFLEFRGRKSDHRGCASSVKLHFFVEFSSVPRFGISSSVELGMPLNEHHRGR